MGLIKIPKELWEVLIFWSFLVLNGGLFFVSHESFPDRTLHISRWLWPAARMAPYGSQFTTFQDHREHFIRHHFWRCACLGFVASLGNLKLPQKFSRTYCSCHLLPTTCFFPNVASKMLYLPLHPILRGLSSKSAKGGKCLTERSRCDILPSSALLPKKILGGHCSMFLKFWHKQQNVHHSNSRLGSLCFPSYIKVHCFHFIWMWWTIHINQW